MKQFALWTFVVIWFLHLALGAGSGYAILRLWPNRKNALIWRLAIYMHATVIGALTSIALVFLSRGVKLTWKFTFAWFLGTLLMDLARVPLILFLVKGRGPADANGGEQIQPSSGALPPEYWEEQFKAISMQIEELKAEVARLRG